MKPQAMAMLPRLASGHSAGLAPTSQGGSTGSSFWLRLLAWNRVARERRQLLDLDPRLLKDIGLSPEEADREASRPFWDMQRPRRSLR